MSYQSGIAYVRAILTCLAVMISLTAVLYFSGLGGSLAWQAFVAYNRPNVDFDPANAVQAPDYADSKNWAALPGKEDPADLVPSGVQVSPQGQHDIDTFFIHPTGFLRSSSWNSAMDPNSGTEENTLWMMANQASAYNGCCNVYAPRYREATIMSYFEETAVRDNVLGFAYEDVKSAFDYYLQNYNQGRPFIIASHSQGSHHAIRLLEEVIDTSELHEQLVAAYLIGSIIVPLTEDRINAMTHISTCQDSNDLHCVVHWDTMPEGSDPLEREEQSLCTNPLSWKTDEAMAEKTLNQGAVVPAGTFNAAIGKGEDSPKGVSFGSLDAPLPEQTWAQCRDGSLFVARQDGTGFEEMGSGNMGSYHGLDYALFYMDIHENAKLRSKVFSEERNR